MLTNLTLHTEIARQRQSALMVRADRHRKSRRSTQIAPETCGAVIDLPRQRTAATRGEALVA